jgi:hypothetical protein
MHVLHFLATEGEDKKDAFYNVKHYLEDQGNCNWSDWHVVGGGRWSNNPDDTRDSIDDTISLYTESKKFIKALESCRESRKDEVLSMIKQLQNSNGEADFMIKALQYAKTGDCNTLDMNLYYFQTIAELLLGNWGSKSYFYDLVSYSTSFNDLQDRMKEKPEEQYLVPVDFHF